MDHSHLIGSTDNAVLESFYNHIKPDGNWRPFRADWNSQHLTMLVLCWLSAIVFAYSILFLTGSLIFHEWTEVIYYLTSTLIAFAVLRYAASKTKIFD